MTLDEAIKHCLEVAEQNKTAATWQGTIGKLKEDCLQCAADHRQLAEWLQELKEAKRLLKLAIEDFDDMQPYLSEPYSCICEKRWRYAAEALAQIGGETNENI